MMLRHCGANGTRCAALDHFRREGVSNLSHDLRSPLTATAPASRRSTRRWAAQRRARRGPAPGRGRAAQHAQRGAHGAVARRPGQARRARVQAAHARSVDVGELLDDIASASPSAPAPAASRCARCRADGAAPPPYAEARRRAVRARDRQPDRQRAEVLPAGAHRSTLAAAMRGRRSRSASPTTAPASRRPTCRTCSIASSRAARTSRRRPAKAARASAWRSSSGSSSCTAARSPSTARWAAAPGS